MATALANDSRFAWLFGFAKTVRWLFHFCKNRFVAGWFLQFLISGGVVFAIPKSTFAKRKRPPWSSGPVYT